MASAWKAPLTTAVTIAVVAGLAWVNPLLQSNGVDVGKIDSLQFGYYFVAALPTFFIGALLYAVYRVPRVLLVCVGCGVAHICSAALTQAARPGMSSAYAMARITYGIAVSVELATFSSAVVPLAVLGMHRFRGKLERVRVGAMVSIISLAVFQIAGVWTNRDSVKIFSGVSLFATIVFGMIAVWCMAFRRVVTSRPPVDATGVVLLTCPRCASAQEIKNGHGSCTRCRLDIWISLNEGVCAKCGYPLRGLMGEKCPECGTAIAEADPVAPGMAGSV